jgi:hypothetical protein
MTENKGPRVQGFKGSSELQTTKDEEGFEDSRVQGFK